MLGSLLLCDLPSQRAILLAMTETLIFSQVAEADGFSIGFQGSVTHKSVSVKRRCLRRWFRVDENLYGWVKPNKETVSLCWQISDTCLSLSNQVIQRPSVLK